MAAWIFIIVLLIAASIGPIQPCLASPYVPHDDAEILQVLPHGQEDIGLQSLRHAYQSDPSNRMLEYKLIDAYTTAGRLEADPRYYGYAEALMKPLLAMPHPDTELWVEEANVLQYRHDFDSSLVLLNKVLRIEPNHPRAHVMRAMIELVGGDYGPAKMDCGSVLSPANGMLTGLTCVSIMKGMSGSLKQSYADLRGYYAQFSDGASTDEKNWALSALGEMAYRLGDNKAAENYYRAALKEKAKDYYTIADFSDLLLAENRPDEAVPLLIGQTQQDNLLVRLVLAEDMRHGPQRDQYIQLLRARIEAVKERKEMVHLGDYARFELYIEKDPQTAYKMAKENWSIQKNPQDSRILIESAFAAGEPLSGRAVMSWLHAKGYEDATFDKYKKM